MTVTIGRRELLAAVGRAAVAWPLAAGAQQPMPVIGLLDIRSPEAMTDRLRAFRQGLKDAGFVEGEKWRSNSPTSCRHRCCPRPRASLGGHIATCVKTKLQRR
jgi:hypothetical protein